MRKTECFGGNRKPFDFEWPLPTDLFNMRKNSQIKIKSLKFKKTSGNGLGALQVILKNGISSPVLTAKGESS